METLIGKREYNLFHPGLSARLSLTTGTTVYDPDRSRSVICQSNLFFRNNFIA